jgi:putative spermidine/putrescine transport system substrate-binding protein
VALAYDADKVKGAPKSWADFWDLKKYPGKRGRRRSAKYTLEIALLADSVAPADVYKILATKQGVDRAFSKLDQIKRDIVWWQAAAEPALFLTDGIFVMTSAYTLWIDRDQQQNKYLKIAWGGSLYDVDSCLSVAKRSGPYEPDCAFFLEWVGQSPNCVCRGCLRHFRR